LKCLIAESPSRSENDSPHAKGTEFQVSPEFEAS
jgi:hypothetical protein